MFRILCEFILLLFGVDAGIVCVPLTARTSFRNFDRNPKIHVFLPPDGRPPADPPTASLVSICLRLATLGTTRDGACDEALWRLVVAFV